MEPTHITEFGSDRYLEKLNAQAAAAPAATSPGPEIPQSRFILPIRGYNHLEPEDLAIKAGEAKRPEKKGFLSFRKFHAKGSVTSSSTEHIERRPIISRVNIETKVSGGSCNFHFEY